MTKYTFEIKDLDDRTIVSLTPDIFDASDIKNLTLMIIKLSRILSKEAYIRGMQKASGLKFDRHDDIIDCA